MPSTILRRRTLNTSQHELPGSLHPVVRQVYLNRGIYDGSELERGLEQLLPFEKLLGIQPSVELLYQALIGQKKILIVGDFDADGATSTSVALLALKAMGAKNVNYIVPNRFEFGYGLTPEIVEVARQLTPEIIITVDNGISSLEGVAYAKQQGIQVLITDHHLPAHELPCADVIVNPNQPNCSFPSKNLAGVGVIFYVMLALRSYLRAQGWFVQQGIPEPHMATYLDLVALGTYADMVPLDRNNRILVYQGLKRIQARRCRPGILALLEIANREPEQAQASVLGFAIGPRLNAAGRLDDMSLGIECLVTDNSSAAHEMAKMLDELNHERRSIEVDMKRGAFAVLERLQQQDLKELPTGICLFDENWHQGVIGILAGRIKETFHRPAIAFAPTNSEEIKGSARSIDGLHIRDLLDSIAAMHPAILKKFGGHAMAAGLSLKKADFSKFSVIFNEAVKEKLSNHLLEKQLWSDGELTEQDFTLPTVEELQNAGPFGQAFPEPLFDGNFEVVSQRLVGGKHLKMTLKKDKRLLDAIAFNVDLRRWPNNRVQEIHAAYHLNINQFRDTRSVQLVLEYIDSVKEN